MISTVISKDIVIASISAGIINPAAGGANSTIAAEDIVMPDISARKRITDPAADYTSAVALENIVMASIVAIIINPAAVVRRAVTYKNIIMADIGAIIINSTANTVRKVVANDTVFHIEYSATTYMDTTAITSYVITTILNC